MRSSRLLSILILLQTRGRMTAQALAATFEVSVRTIYRDIDALSASGVPVYADRGPSGGFQLLDGYRTRLTGMTPGEAETLFLAGLPGAAAELGLAEAMSAARLKLLAALPDDRRLGAERIGARFHLDPVNWFRDGDSVGRLPEIARTVWNEQRLFVRYERWSGEVERLLEPLGLVLKAGVWYLVAQVDGAPRAYRASNILAMTVLDERFVRPAAFDLAAFWTRWTARYEADIYKDVAQVRSTARGLSRLREINAALGAAARAAPPPDAGGWSVLTIPIETVDQAARDILRLGGEVEALAPPALRARVRELALRLAGGHAGDHETVADGG
ncbi:transcriptional regulator [Caulobacter sp. CCUG 60055]|nr:WYL domain-containing protein [Caulobacter sp. CCUG 60055]MCI3181342.1 transcriptional regulator [Caulobacter sp. CCUG 60055]